MPQTPDTATAPTTSTTKAATPTMSCYRAKRVGAAGRWREA